MQEGKVAKKGDCRLLLALGDADSCRNVSIDAAPTSHCR